MTPTHAPTPSTLLARVLARLPRMAGWLLIAVGLAAAVGLLAPHQLPVTLYKLSLVVAAAVVGYWLDRSLFPYARPDDLLAMWSQEPLPKFLAFGAAMLRRALIVAAAMLAVGLGA